MKKYLWVVNIIGVLIGWILLTGSMRMYFGTNMKPLSIEFLMFIIGGTILYIIGKSSGEHKDD